MKSFAKAATAMTMSAVLATSSVSLNYSTEKMEVVTENNLSKISGPKQNGQDGDSWQGSYIY